MIDWTSRNVGENGDILVLELSGRIGAVECDYLLTVVEEQIKSGQRRMVLDCGDVKFISSLGLGMLVRVHGRMKKNGGDVKLACVRGVFAEALKAVMLDKILNIYASADDAVESYSL